MESAGYYANSKNLVINSNLAISNHRLNGNIEEKRHFYMGTAENNV